MSTVERLDAYVALGTKSGLGVWGNKATWQQLFGYVPHFVDQLNTHRSVLEFLGGTFRDKKNGKLINPPQAFFSHQLEQMRKSQMELSETVQRLTLALTNECRSSSMLEIELQQRLAELRAKTAGPAPHAAALRTGVPHSVAHQPAGGTSFNSLSLIPTDGTDGGGPPAQRESAGPPPGGMGLTDVSGPQDMYQPGTFRRNDLTSEQLFAMSRDVDELRATIDSMHNLAATLPSAPVSMTRMHDVHLSATPNDQLMTLDLGQQLNEVAKADDFLRQVCNNDMRLLDETLQQYGTGGAPPVRSSEAMLPKSTLPLALSELAGDGDAGCGAALRYEQLQMLYQLQTQQQASMLAQQQASQLHALHAVSGGAPPQLGGGALGDLFVQQNVWKHSGPGPPGVGAGVQAGLKRVREFDDQGGQEDE